MAATGDSEERTELGRSLLALRRAANLTQIDVVSRTGISQAQLSRFERGAALPTDDEAEELGRLYGADAQQRAELAQAVKDARAGIRDSRLVIQRGSTLAMQRRWRSIERDARRIRAYQPAMVLGILQHPAYASVVLAQPETADVVQDRMLRHQQMLATTEREHVLIQTEGSLRFTVGSREVMAAQLDRLRDLTRRPAVRLGVIPSSRVADVVTANGFHIYDDRAVIVGLEVAAATLTGADDVAHFVQLFAELERLAVFGDEARKLLTRIAADYR